AHLAWRHIELQRPPAARAALVFLPARPAAAARSARLHPAGDLRTARLRSALHSRRLILVVWQQGGTTIEHGMTISSYRRQAAGYRLQLVACSLWRACK